MTPNPTRTRPERSIMRRLALSALPAVPLALLLTLAACAAPAPSNSDSSSGADAGSDGGAGTADFATCDELEAALLDTEAAQYPGGTTTPVTYASVTPLPEGVTFPEADCAWQTVPGADSNVSGEFWETVGYYLTDDSAILEDLAAQLAAAGCSDQSADGVGEAFCNVESDIPEGWVVYYADYPISLGSGLNAMEISLTYQKG
jgi:hypothetical protein